MSGGGEDVAAAAGHCTDRTQAHYGRVQHGRKRKGYLSITAARPPRCDNVERARQLSRAKGLRQKNKRMFVKGPRCAGTIFTTTVLALPVKLCFQRQGAADVCMSFRGALEQTKGAIINIASMNATLALPRIPL